jgi:ABC-type branched-subunit amino acid transport system ATPase component
LSSPAEPLLAAEGVAAAYGDVEVLHDIGLTVHAGEGVVVVGRNGAGKSTLVRVLAGLHPARRGTIRLAATDVTHVDTVGRVGLGLTGVIGGEAVFGTLTVEENLRAFAHRVGRADMATRIATAYDALPTLAERRRQLASTLSGGQQQQLGLAKALVLRPRVLLIDEPTLGLAPIVAASVLQLLRDLRAEGTALVISDESLVCCDCVERAVLLRRGEVVGEHPAHDLRSRTDVLADAFDLDAARTPR